jgi:prephenate dehydratase
MNVAEFELVPLVSSANVMGQLKRGEIDLGVVAVKNSTGGIVRETLDVIRNEHLELVNTEVLYIRHCLFKKDAHIRNTDITRVISHEQALRQCTQHLAEVTPNAVHEPIADTAIGAKYLAQGEYDDHTAVLCSRSAGEARGLFLEREDMQDDPENRTEFRMFRVPSVQIDNNRPTRRFDKIGLYAINDQGGLGYLTQGLMVAAIFIAFLGMDQLGWSRWEAATTVAGTLSVAFLFLTSSKLRNALQYRSILGYWKYFAIPEHEEEGKRDQRYETPRVVQIKEIEGKLAIRGWLCDRENVPLFKSDLTLLSPLGQRTGSLVYWYSDPTQRSREFGLNGIVALSWELEHPASKINTMSGWYMGRSTDDTGSIAYVRISEAEFNILMKSDYLR